MAVPKDAYQRLGLLAMIDPIGDRAQGEMMPVLRTRASTYIYGAADDTEALACHLHSYLKGP